eukprot:CAMPEP_0117763280 /NCGR_PEP_ID=MMETSP0947-20121206/18534_1 /TAXON_ID=44440 /ORGANISM="Chattonella subsalsa, Strain CCMP2191" /LENGTH=55 /DNA_ID=CAMNT_0005584937 /DNA_START=41 /DNA_END=204 /DNA_ORIENTATION=-
MSEGEKELSSFDSNWALPSSKFEDGITCESLSPEVASGGVFNDLIFFRSGDDMIT